MRMVSLLEEGLREVINWSPSSILPQGRKMKN